MVRVPHEAGLPHCAQLVFHAGIAISLPTAGNLFSDGTPGNGEGKVEEKSTTLMVIDWKSELPDHVEINIALASTQMRSLSVKNIEDHLLPSTRSISHLVALWLTKQR